MPARPFAPEAGMRFSTGNCHKNERRDAPRLIGNQKKETQFHAEKQNHVCFNCDKLHMLDKFSKAG